MKYRKSFAVVSQIRREEKKAKKEHKVAVLGFQQRGLKTRYYLINEKLMAILMERLSVAVSLEASSSVPDSLSQKPSPQLELL